MTEASASPATTEVLFDRDFITLYRGLDPALCHAVVERFHADDRKTPGRVYRHGEALGEDAAVKHSWDLEIRDEGAWRDIFRAIHPRAHACIGHYLSRSPVLQSFELQATGYKIQMYPRGAGFFRWHADATGRGVQSRQAAMILYLNDVAEGGETEFFHQGLKFAPRAGQLLLFPAAWTHMHRGAVPVSGDKLVVQTFVRIKEA